jgi:peptidoglycan hydrolase-like protein with peptidoglycan-binding domain
VTKVKAWQTARNLSASGKVDVATWRALLKPASTSPAPAKRSWDSTVTTSRRPR